MYTSATFDEFFDLGHQASLEFLRGRFGQCAGLGCELHHILHLGGQNGFHGRAFVEPRLCERDVPLGRSLQGQLVQRRIVRARIVQTGVGGDRADVLALSREGREVLEALPLDKIKSDGYSFQIEMNFHAWKRKFRIVEMPIVFVDRREGTSKMSRRIIFEAVFLVWKLRFASIFNRLP